MANDPQTPPTNPTPPPAATTTDSPVPVSRPAHKLSRVMAFMNQKGGVGKTTTVVNLAAAIANQGRSALVIDLDPQAHATLHLGVDMDARELSVYDLLLNPKGLAAAQGTTATDEIDAEEVLVEARPNLGLIPAVVDQAAVEGELANADRRQQRLSLAITPLLKRYEFVLIDCPPSLGLLTLNGLALAREVIVPMQAHFLALQGVGKLLETVSLMAQSVNPKLRVSGVILSNHEDNSRHSREVVADLEAFFASAKGTAAPWAGARVMRPAVRRNIKLAESPSFGETVFEYAPGCAGAQDFQALAESVVGEWDRWLAGRGLSAQVEPSAMGSPSAVG